VVVIPGNHDIAQSSHLATALEPVSFLGVHVVQKPSSLLLDVEGKKVKVDCLPYPSRGRLSANMQDRKTCTSEELTAYINRGLYNILNGFQLDVKFYEIDMEPESNIPYDYRILVAHGSVEQAVVGEQPRTLAHDVFLPIADIAQKYDYVALGHIHKTQSIADRGMYCGSLLRQGFGEEKEQKGFLVCDFTPGGVITTHIENPHARVYKTLSVKDLAEFQIWWPKDHEIVFRIKDTIPEDSVPHIMPLIQRFTQALPFVQVDVTVQHEDRTRDSQLSNQMNSGEALERCLARDGIGEPSLSICRQLHLELCEEISR
jgi:DNA repair exonuclease SbcCD nuclease subunit